MMTVHILQKLYVLYDEHFELPIHLSQNKLLLPVVKVTTSVESCGTTFKSPIIAKPVSSGYFFKSPIFHFAMDVS
jgi:hypothetical protein